MRGRNLARSHKLESLRRRLKAIPAAVKSQIRDALDKSADEMVATMKRLAPVDEGALRESIRKEPGDHDLSVKVTAGGPMTTKEVRKGSGAEYDYALGVEFGTSDTAAQPFFWPSYRLGRKRVKARSKRAVTKAVKSTKRG